METTMNIRELCRASFDCVCGRKHQADIQKIVVENGALDKTGEVLAPLAKKTVLLVADKITAKVAGQTVLEGLKKQGQKARLFVYEEEYIQPDAYALGRLMLEIDREVSVLCGIGSGVINDVTGLAAYRAGLPFVIVATAPSMDGYASKISPMVVDRFKQNVQRTYPYAIVADTAVIKEAPMVMIQAGFGDMIGKVIALADWKLGVTVHGEFYCETLASMMEHAMNQCIDGIEAVMRREERAVSTILEGLIFAGLVMGLYEETRPASGSEHFFAHYWDVDAIGKGQTHALHGNSVAVGTVIAAMLYEKAERQFGLIHDVPSSSHIKMLLRKMEAPCHPDDIGVERDVVHDSILHAMDGRDRYTILQYLDEKNVLKRYSDEVVEQLYEA